MMKNLTLTYLKTSLLFWHPFCFNKGKKEALCQKCPGHFAGWMTYLFSEAGRVTPPYIHLPMYSQDSFPKCWIYCTPTQQQQHTETHRHLHRSCLFMGSWETHGKKEMRNNVQLLEHFMSIQTGSRISCSSSGSTAPSCQFSWEPHRFYFIWYLSKRWTIKLLKRKWTQARD